MPDCSERATHHRGCKMRRTLCGRRCSVDRDGGAGVGLADERGTARFVLTGRAEWFGWRPFWASASGYWLATPGGRSSVDIVAGRVLATITPQVSSAEVAPRCENPQFDVRLFAGAKGLRFAESTTADTAVRALVPPLAGAELVIAGLRSSRLIGSRIFGRLRAALFWEATRAEVGGQGELEVTYAWAVGEDGASF